MKFLIICLTLLVQPGCASVPITELDLSPVPFCDYRHLPAGIPDRLKEDERGIALKCPDIEEVNPVADIKIMPYAPLHARIVGMIFVKKSLSYEPYCRMIGANIIVRKLYHLIDKKGYDVYDAYYSDK